MGGRPVFDYIVERMRAVRPDEIRVVTRPDKTDVLDHARRLGLTTVEAEPPTLAASISAGLRGLDADDVVLVGLPDSLWEPVDGFAALLGKLAPGADVALGAFHSAEPERGDVVELVHADRVAAVHVKSSNPPGELVWGIAAARAGALSGLNGHSEPGHLFDELAREGRVHAVRFPGEFLDIGTKEALARARRLLD